MSPIVVRVYYVCEVGLLPALGWVTDTPARSSRMRFFFFFSSRRRHTRCSRDWSSDVCSSDLRRFHHPDDAPLAVRSRSAHRLDRPDAVLPPGVDVPHALQPRDRRRAPRRAPQDAGARARPHRAGARARRRPGRRDSRRDALPLARSRAPARLAFERWRDRGGPRERSHAQHPGPHGVARAAPPPAPARLKPRRSWFRPRFGPLTPGWEKRPTPPPDAVKGLRLHPPGGKNAPPLQEAPPGEPRP